MSEAIITVENLGKRYSLRHLRDQRYVALRDVLVEKATGLFRRNGKSPSSKLQAPGSSKEDFWALRDVSFEVQPGEVVGIIGRNGAGKSTLLKILSRITDPTEGRVKLSGRVASLLEVGTGFHPELTGRENIYLNGAILGMGRTEIRKKFDEIVAFAETEKFLDTPVKRYSSGMYVRLAFAVAAHLEPEILVVDEVLAVGDAEFQKKCLGKMQQVATSEGRTVLFVSHNIQAIRALCSKALYLESGRIVGFGSVAAQATLYESAAYSTAARSSTILTPNIFLEHLWLTPNPISSGADLEVDILLRARAAVRLTELCLLLYSALGIRVAIFDLRPYVVPVSVKPAQSYSISAFIRALALVEGSYSIGLWINSDAGHGNFFDITTLIVAARETVKEGSIPYTSDVRGIVEFDFEASAKCDINSADDVLEV